MKFGQRLCCPNPTSSCSGTICVAGCASDSISFSGGLSYTILGPNFLLPGPSTIVASGTTDETGCDFVMLPSVGSYFLDISNIPDRYAPLISGFNPLTPGYGGFVPDCLSEGGFGQQFILLAPVSGYICCDCFNAPVPAKLIATCDSQEVEINACGDEWCLVVGNPDVIDIGSPICSNEVSSCSFGGDTSAIFAWGCTSSGVQVTQLFPTSTDCDQEDDGMGICHPGEPYDYFAATTIVGTGVPTPSNCGQISPGILPTCVWNTGPPFFKSRFVCQQGNEESDSHDDIQSVPVNLSFSFSDAPFGGVTITE